MQALFTYFKALSTRSFKPRDYLSWPAVTEPRALLLPHHLEILIVSHLTKLSTLAFAETNLLPQPPAIKRQSANEIGNIGHLAAPFPDETRLAGVIARALVVDI